MKTGQRKLALILGGSSGIGKAISQRFAKEGWGVIIASSDAEKSRRALETLQGDGHQRYLLDVRNTVHLQAVVAAFTAQQLQIDVFINSVGISEQLAVLDSDFGEWDNALQVMLYGAVRCCRAFVPLINPGGRIVHITSVHHDRVERGSSSYGMAKAAITQFTRSLALELAPKNILANSIAPGFVNTPMSVKDTGENELESEWFKDNYIKYDHLPLKRAAAPEEIAGVAYFLGGPDATYITGSVITVDGGLTITF